MSTARLERPGERVLLCVLGKGATFFCFSAQRVPARGIPPSSGVRSSSKEGKGFLNIWCGHSNKLRFGELT